MGALVGLGVGCGLLLIWIAFVGSPVPAARERESRTARLLAEAGASRMTPTTLVAAQVAVFLVVALVLFGTTQTPPIALVVGALASYLPRAMLAGRATRRRREFAQVWPDAVDDLASAVRAGMSLPDAVAALGVRGPDPLRPAFAAFALDYQVSGRFGDCLDRLKDRLADPIGDRVIEGLRVAREVGGGELGRLLRNLSGYIRDEQRTRSELEARQSWTVNGARLAVAAPWLVLLAMSGQPEVIQRYRSPTGAVILTVCALVCVVAYRLMMRIGRLPTERRILA